MKTNEISNVDVAVYILATLGGAEKTVYSEHIAAKCYEVAPGRFSWRLPDYREKGWPDKYIVKTALEDAKKDELWGTRRRCLCFGCKDDHLIADDVLAKMQQRVRDFVANAHASMLSDQDVKAALR